MFQSFIQRFSQPLLLLYMLPGILIGLTVHEWAHAYVAYRLGDPTARNLGRMTLNPFAHIDIFGFLCLLLVGFGWAKPVPVNPRNFKNYKRDDILVSLAGIAMNFITAFLAVLIYVLCLRIWPQLYDNDAFVYILTYLIVINLSLMLFNLIPIYPLDGSHVLECLLARKEPRFFMFMRQYGQYILIVLLITGLVSTGLSFLVQKIYYGLFWLASSFIGLF